jgi:AhpD family alkylhydroperoxidase
MRLDYARIAPDFILPLRDLTARQGATALDQRLRALVEIRVSQLNRCAYCIDLHAREALHQGEDLQRILLLDAWRESGLFTEREQAALEWAEVRTRIDPDDERSFARLQEAFTPEEIVLLTISIALANTWNRIAGGFHRQPPARSLPMSVRQGE